MAGVVTKVVGKRMLKDNKYLKDPYHEEVQIKDKRGRVVKVKKQKRKEQFLFIPEHDRQILLHFRKWAYRLDNSIGNVAGLSSIIGLIPFIGDGLDCLLALWLINSAMRISGGKDAKDVKKMRNLMMANLIFDGAIGLVPVLGDIADTIFKCNTRNVVLLEHLLTKRARKVAGALDSSEKLPQDRPVATFSPNKGVHPAKSSNPTSASSSPPQQHESPRHANNVVITGPTSSTPSWTKHHLMMIKEWFNGFRKVNKEADVEKAEGPSDLHARAQVDRQARHDFVESGTDRAGSSVPKRPSNA